VAGAAIALFAAPLIEGSMVFLLGFAAGGFIYIASSDLIPELHRGATCEAFTSKSLMQLFFLLLGIAVMYSLLFLE
jgi:zinc and cadmium transporter